MAKQLNVSLAFTADTGKAKAQIQDLQKTLSQIASATHGSDTVFITKELKEAQTVAAQLQVTLQNAFNTKTGSLDLTKFNDSLKKGGLSLKQVQDKLYSMGPAGEQAFSQLAHSITLAEVPLRRSSALLDQFKTSLMNTARWQISSSILHGFMGSIQGAIGYAEDLNKSLNNIRIVTGMSTDQMAQFAEQANKAAQALSTRTTDYTDAALIYYQQGIRDQNEIAARTETTLKLANVSHQSAQQVSDQMTAIWNNFDDGTQSLEYYADVITALGASTASSSEEISKGLEKFAAVADTVGLSYENAAAAVATIVAETRQSADTVGTGLRTLFSRLQSLKLGETLEDGVGLSKYSAALESVGVKVLDINGEVRNMDDILGDLGAKWNDISDSQQIALAQTVGGVRQYTNLIALMDNWDKMQQNVGIASGSEGTLQKQQDIYAESWEAASKRVKAAAEEIYQSLLNDDFFIGLNDGFASVLNSVSKFIESIGGVRGVLVSLGAIFSNIFQKEIANGLSNMAHNIAMMTGKGREAAKQTKIEANNLLIDQSVNNGTMAGAMAADAYKATAQAQLSYINNVNRMSEAERQVNQILLERNQTLADQVAESAKITQDAQRQAEIQQAVMKSAQNKMPSGVQGGFIQFKEDFDEASANFAQLSVGYEAIYNAKNALSGFGQNSSQDIEKTTQALSNFKQELVNSGLSIDELKSKGGTFKEIGETLEKIKPESSLGELNQIIQELEGHMTALASDVGAAEGTLTQAEQNFRGVAAGCGLTTEQINKYIDSVNNSNNLTEEQKIKLLQAKAAALEHAKAMDEASKNAMTLSSALSQAFNIAMSGAMIIRQITGLFKTLSDDSASFTDKLTAVLMTLGMVGPAIVGTIIPAIGSLTTSVTIAGHAIHLAFWEVTLIVGAITTLVAFGPKIAKFFGFFQESNLDKAADELERIKSVADEASEHLETISQKYEALCQDFDEYTSIIENLHNCKKGTDEWNEALEQTSNKVKELLQQYPELASYALVKDKESGLWIIDKQKFEEVKKQHEQREIAARTASTLSGVKQEQAQQQYDSEKYKQDVNSVKDTMVSGMQDVIQKFDEEFFEAFNGKMADFFMFGGDATYRNLAKNMSGVEGKSADEQSLTLLKTGLYNFLGDSGIYDVINEGQGIKGTKSELKQNSSLEEYAAALGIDDYEETFEGLSDLAEQIQRSGYSMGYAQIENFEYLANFFKDNTQQIQNMLDSTDFINQLQQLKTKRQADMQAIDNAYETDVKQYQEGIHNTLFNLIASLATEYEYEGLTEEDIHSLADNLINSLFGNFDESIGDYTGGLVNEKYNEMISEAEEENFNFVKQYLQNANKNYNENSFDYNEDEKTISYKDGETTETIDLWNFALQMVAENFIATNDQFQAMITNMEEAVGHLKEYINNNNEESTEIQSESAVKFAKQKNFNNLTQEEINALTDDSFKASLKGADFTGFGFEAGDDQGYTAYIKALEEADKIHQEAVDKTSQIRDNLNQAGENSGKLTDEMFTTLQSIYTQLSSGILGSKMGDSFLSVITDVISKLEGDELTEFLSNLDTFDFSETGLLNFAQQLSDAGFNIDTTSEAWTTFIQNINENQPNLPDYNGFVEQLKGVASVIQSLDYGAIIKDDEFNNLIAFYGDLADKFTDLADGRHQFLGTHDELMSAIQDELKIQKEQAKTNVELAEQIKAPEGGYLSTLNLDKTGSYNKYDFKKNILDDESVMELLKNIGYEESRVNEIFSNLENSTEGAIEEAKQLYIALDAALNGDYKNIDQTEQALASLATTMEELYSMTEGEDPLVNSANAINQANILLSQSSSLDDFNKNLALMQDMNIEPTAAAMNSFIKTLEGSDFQGLDDLNNFISSLPVDKIDKASDSYKRLVADVIANDQLLTVQEKLQTITDELGETYVAEHYQEILTSIFNASGSSAEEKLSILNQLLAEGTIDAQAYSKQLKLIGLGEAENASSMQELTQIMEKYGLSIDQVKSKALELCTNLIYLNQLYKDNTISLEEYQALAASMVQEKWNSVDSLESLDNVKSESFQASMDNMVPGNTDLLDNASLYSQKLLELGQNTQIATQEVYNYKEALEELGRAQIEVDNLNQQNYDKPMYDDEKAEASKKLAEAKKELAEAEDQLRASITASEGASKYGLDAKEIENQAKQIRKLDKALEESGESYEMSAEEATQLAIANQRMNKGVATLNKNFSKWRKTLESTEKTSMDYANAMTNVESAISDLIGAGDDFDLPDGFLDMPGMLNKIEKASQGDVKAINEIGLACGAASVQAMELDESFANINNISPDAFNSYKDQVISGINDITANLPSLLDGTMSIDEAMNGTSSGWVEALNQMAMATGMSVQQMNSLLNSLGVQAKVDVSSVPQKMEVPTYTEYSEVSQSSPAEYVTGSNGERVMSKPPTWAKKTWTVPGPPIEVDGYAQVAQISTVDGDIGAPQINYTGVGGTGGSSGGPRGGGVSPSSSGGGGGGGGGCFIAGTPITLINSFENIENIKIGDIVLSYNEEKRQNEYSQVVQTMIHFVYENIYTLYINNEKLIVTGIHRFLIKRENNKQEWIPASHLQIGDLVFFADGTWHTILDISMRIKAEVVYNFEVSGNHNYYVGQNQILAHNKGGGGGGKKETKEHKDPDDEKDRYHKIKIQIGDLTDAYNKVSKAKDRAFGPARVRYIDKEIAAQKKLMEAQERYIKEIEAYWKADAAHMQQSYGAQIDNMGVITNYDEMFDQQLAAYNAAVDRYNASAQTDDDKQALQDAEEAWETFKKWLARYEETNELLQEQRETLQDQIDALYDLGSEKIQYVVEFRLQANENIMNFLDYLDHKLQSYTTSASDLMERLTLIGQKMERITDVAIPINQQGIQNTLGHFLSEGSYLGEDGQRHQVSDLLANIPNPTTGGTGMSQDEFIQQFMAGGINESNPAVMELFSHMTQQDHDALMQYANNLTQNLNDLLDLREEYIQLELETQHRIIDDAFQEVEESVHRAQTLYSHLNNLIDTVGKGTLGLSNDFIRQLDKNTVDAANIAVKTAKEKQDYWAHAVDERTKELEDAQKAYDEATTDAAKQAAKASVDRATELLNDAKESLTEATDDLNAKTIEAAQAARQQLEHELDMQKEEGLNRKAMDMGYKSWAQFKEEVEYADKMAERYVSQYKEIYEISKLNRDINRSIDDTDNIKNKKALKDLQVQINKELEKTGQLTQYDLDNARRKYELELARLQLEEAGNTKDTVRLSKDSEGNWSYVYTASEEDVAAAEQNYEDKLYAMQEANENYIRELNHMLIEEEEEYYDKVKEIMLDESRSVEERMESVQRLTDFHSETATFIGQECDKVIANNKILYDKDWTWYSEYTAHKADMENQETALQGQRYAYRLGDADKYTRQFNQTMLGQKSTYDSLSAMTDAWAGQNNTYLGNVNTAFGNYETNVRTTLGNAGWELDQTSGHIHDFEGQATTSMNTVAGQARDASEDVEGLGEAAVTSFNKLVDQGKKWATAFNNNIIPIIETCEACVGVLQRLDDALSADAANSVNQGYGDAEEIPGSESGGDIHSGGNGNSNSTSSGNLAWDRIRAAYEAINQGKAGVNPVRPELLEKLGFTKEEAAAGQKLVNLVYPRHLGGSGMTMEDAKKAMGFETGGYTGDWFGDGGRLAILHSKELVLNKDDTENILDAVDMVRKLSSIIEIGAKISEYSLANLSAQSGAYSRQQIEQTITINAEFPNATDRNEIAEAFNTLINEATQYANRKNF